MEAKKTAGPLMTERVVRDYSSGLLETTSNRPWSAAKTNTHQLLQRERGKERERGAVVVERNKRKGEREREE